MFAPDFPALTPLNRAPVCRLKTVDLPFQTHFTRSKWERRATNTGIVGYHARKWLAGWTAA